MPKLDACRICGCSDFEMVLDLGRTPLANEFLMPEQAQKQETHPLRVNYCKTCSHLQLGYYIDPEILFRHYLYFSSNSPMAEKHFADLAQILYTRFLKPNDLAVEVASNDGIFLRNLKPKPIHILGVEPAKNIAKVAIENGIPTHCDFFCYRSAQDVRAARGQAALISGCNVFAHVLDLHDFMKGVDHLLKDDGVFMVEFPYAMDLIERMEFDTIYHEHLSYFLLRPLTALFAKHRMHVFDVQRVSIHGGSIRVFVQKDGTGKQPVNPIVERLLRDEKEKGFYDLETYKRFSQKVGLLKADLVQTLSDLKRGGKRIFAYGAAAKGSTLLNYYGIGHDTIEFIVDRSPHKVGRLSPGTHIPVISVEKFKADYPDYLLVLAWNFYEEIVEQQAEFQAAGGHFIIPVPTVQIK